MGSNRSGRSFRATDLYRILILLPDGGRALLVPAGSAGPVPGLVAAVLPYYWPDQGLSDQGGHWQPQQQHQQVLLAGDCKIGLHLGPEEQRNYSLF